MKKKEDQKNEKKSRECSYIHRVGNNPRFFFYSTSWFIILSTSHRTWTWRKKKLRHIRNHIWDYEEKRISILNKWKVVFSVHVFQRSAYYNVISNIIPTLFLMDLGILKILLLHQPNLLNFMIASNINPDTIFLQSNHENLIAKSSQFTKWKPERFEIQPRNPISSTTARFIGRPLTRNVGESLGQWSEWRGHTTRIKLIPISHRAKDSPPCRHSPGLVYPLGNHLIQIITRLIIRRQISLSYVNQIYIFSSFSGW